MQTATINKDWTLSVPEILNTQTGIILRVIPAIRKLEDLRPSDVPLQIDLRSVFVDKRSIDLIAIVNAMSMELPLKKGADTQFSFLVERLSSKGKFNEESDAYIKYMILIAATHKSKLSVTQKEDLLEKIKASDIIKAKVASHEMKVSMVRSFDHPLLVEFKNHVEKMRTQLLFIETIMKRFSYLLKYIHIEIDPDNKFQKKMKFYFALSAVLESSLKASEKIPLIKKLHSFYKRVAYAFPVQLGFNCRILSISAFNQLKTYRTNGYKFEFHSKREWHAINHQTVTSYNHFLNQMCRTKSPYFRHLEMLSKTAIDLATVTRDGKKIVRDEHIAFLRAFFPHSVFDLTSSDLLLNNYGVFRFGKIFPVMADPKSKMLKLLNRESGKYEPYRVNPHSFVDFELKIKIDEFEEFTIQGNVLELKRDWGIVFPFEFDKGVCNIFKLTDDHFHDYMGAKFLTMSVVDDQYEKLALAGISLYQNIFLNLGIDQENNRITKSHTLYPVYNDLITQKVDKDFVWRSESFKAENFLNYEVADIFKKQPTLMKEFEIALSKTFPAIMQYYNEIEEYQDKDGPLINKLTTLPSKEQHLTYQLFSMIRFMWDRALADEDDEEDDQKIPNHSRFFSDSSDPHTLEKIYPKLYTPIKEIGHKTLIELIKILKSQFKQTDYFSFGFGHAFTIVFPKNLSESPLWQMQLKDFTEKKRFEKDYSKRRKLLLDLELVVLETEKVNGGTFYQK